MSRLRQLPRLVRGVALAGGILFCVVLPTLRLVGGIPLADSVLLTLLLVALPVLAVAQLPLADATWIERLPAYWGSIATLWLIGTASWFVGTRAGGPEAVGVVGLAPWPMVAWTAGLTAAGLGTIVLFRWAALRLGIPESPILRHLLPRTRRERGVFAVLSVTAGVCEEVAFRGYAIPALAPLLGVAGAAIVTSLVFGVLHAYQGVLGMVRTGVMGIVLAVGFLTAGSLWPAIGSHVLIDLIAGMVLGEKLLSPEPVPGVQESAHPGSTGT